jgi:hypothetical protein
MHTPNSSPVSLLGPGLSDVYPTCVPPPVRKLTETAHFHDKASAAGAQLARCTQRMPVYDPK